MRRILGRTRLTETTPPTARVDQDAHGCPACPHPAPGALRDVDDDGPSTLLPHSHTDLDGRAFTLEELSPLDAFGSDGDIGDFDVV